MEDDFMMSAPLRGPRSSHLSTFQQQLKHHDDDMENETVVIIGDGSTADAEGEFLRGFGGSKQRSYGRGNSKDGSGSRSNSVDLPKNVFTDNNSIESRRLSPVVESKFDNEDDIEDNDIEQEDLMDKKGENKTAEISEVERAFASNGNSNYSEQHGIHIGTKDVGNFSVFADQSNFSVFGNDFADDAERDHERELQGEQPSAGAQGRHNPHTGNTPTPASTHSQLLSSAASGAKMHISNISKVIPSLSSMGSSKVATPPTNNNANAEQSNSTSTAPSNGNNRASTKYFEPLPSNGAPFISADGEKSANEKQMISQNKSYIRSRFDDVDEKGNIICKFQCQIYWAKQFEAVRQCYFKDVDNENYIRSLCMSSSWTAQGGKSGASFSKTLDDRIVIKVISLVELRMFNEFAPAYFEYMAKAYYHQLPTVLCKILGVYTVRYHNKETGKRVVENVVAMENIFYQRNITRTFDLKGSSRARYVEVGADQRMDNFDEALLKRRRGRRNQMSKIDSNKRDVLFRVKRLLHKKKKGKTSLQQPQNYKSDAIRRNEILQCLHDVMDRSGSEHKGVDVKGVDVEEYLHYEMCGSQQPQRVNQVLLDDNLMELTRGRPFPLKHRAKLFFHKAVLNDTLFLSIVNVVDYSILVGFDENTHEIVVGIIDYLRQYDFIKRMERMGKSVGMFAGQAEPTIIQPSHYRKRFSLAMERYFMTVPDKWIAHDS